MDSINMVIGFLKHGWCWLLSITIPYLFIFIASSSSYILHRTRKHCWSHNYQRWSGIGQVRSKGEKMNRAMTTCQATNISPRHLFHLHNIQITVDECMLLGKRVSFNIINRINKFHRNIKSVNTIFLKIYTHQWSILLVTILQVIPLTGIEQ